MKTVEVLSKLVTMVLVTGGADTTSLIGALSLGLAGLDSRGMLGALVISAGAVLVWLPGTLSAGALEEATGAAEAGSSVPRAR